MPTIADSHDQIQVRGARENNLAGISLDIPKRRLTVFTGSRGPGSRPWSSAPSPPSRGG
jgi:excinuclease UvrABC ATPase subunit